MPSTMDRELTESASMYSLRDLVSPLFRRWRFTLTLFLVLLVVGSLLLMAVGPQYTSHMSVLISRERQDPLVSAQVTKDLITPTNPVSDEEVNSEVELLRSPDVLERVVLETGLSDAHPGVVSSLRDLVLGKRSKEARVDKAVTALAKKLKIELVIKTNVINVSYTSDNPRLAYSVVHSLGENFERKEAEVHRPSGSSKFFETQTDTYQKALTESESDLKNFSDNSQFGSPDLEQGDLAAQVTTAMGQVQATSQAIAADEARIATDEQQLITTPERVATTVSNADADKMIGDVEVVLLAAQTKQTELRAKYAPTYPAVREADKEVADATAALKAAEATKFNTNTTDRDPTHELVREDLAKTQEDLVAQRARRAATQQSVANLRLQLVELNREAITRNDLMRNAKANEDNYLLYLAKREQERMSDALNGALIANATISGPPTMPIVPDNGMPFLILALMFGTAAASILITYAVTYMDSTLYTPDQVFDTLHIPLVIAVRNTA